MIYYVDDELSIIDKWGGEHSMELYLIQKKEFVLVSQCNIQYLDSCFVLLYTTLYCVDLFFYILHYTVGWKNTRSLYFEKYNI